jgi:hypothetical protein
MEIENARKADKSILFQIVLASGHPVPMQCLNNAETLQLQFLKG